jgi:hypothetical protein
MDSRWESLVAVSSSPISIKSHSSPLARRMCLVSRPSSMNPNFRYKAMAALLWGNTLNVSLCSPRACAHSDCGSYQRGSHSTSAPVCGDHHRDLAETETALYDKDDPNDFARCKRDQRAIQVPVRCPLLNVDRRLGRDPVTFLCDCRKKECERTSISILRGPNLNGLRRGHAQILTETVRALGIAAEPVEGAASARPGKP